MSDPRIPLSKARALNPDFYVKTEIYKHEMKTILPSGWQVVAPADRLSGIGDVISRQLGDIPIVIVRSKSGQLNGFYNICPHRAGPLATCDARGTKRLRCGGQLKSATEMDKAEDFDWKNIRLSPIGVKEWNGLIFARAGDGLNFETVFDGIDDVVGDKLNGMTHHTLIVYDVHANWKVYVDNFLEGYHLPFVHPDLTQVVDYSLYKTDLGKYWSLQRSPVDADVGAYGAGEALYYFIYPNTMLNIMPGRLQTNRVIPVDINSCKVEFDFYYAPGVEFRAQEDIEFSNQVQEEDRLICEHVQKGLTSGVYKPGRLSPSREEGVWHWQNILRDAYQAAKLL